MSTKFVLSKYDRFYTDCRLTSDVLRDLSISQFGEVLNEFPIWLKDHHHKRIKKQACILINNLLLSSAFINVSFDILSIKKAILDCKNSPTEKNIIIILIENKEIAKIDLNLLNCIFIPDDEYENMVRYYANIKWLIEDFQDIDNIMKKFNGLEISKNIAP